MKIYSIPTACILLISLLGTANAGIMITEQDEGMTGSILYQDGVMIQLDGNKKAGMIVNVTKKQCTWLNHDSRKFARGCHILSDLTKDIKSKGNNYMDDIMSRMPPEQVAMMKKEMENEKRNQPAFQTKKIGSTNFQGFTVNKFRLFVKGDLVAEVWLSPDLHVALSKEVNAKAIAEILGFGDDKENVSGFNVPDMQELLENEIVTLAEKENSHIIKSMKFMSRNTPSDAKVFGPQVIEIKTKKFNLGQYKLPSGYKEVKSFFELGGFNIN